VAGGGIRTASWDGEAIDSLAVSYYPFSPCVLVSGVVVTAAHSLSSSSSASLLVMTWQWHLVVSWSVNMGGWGGTYFECPPSLVSLSFLALFRGR
jgi:hypothetical protein